MSGSSSPESPCSPSISADIHLHSLFLNNGASQGFMYMVDSQEPSQFNEFDHHRGGDPFGYNSILSPISNFDSTATMYATKEGSGTSRNATTVEERVVPHPYSTANMSMCQSSTVSNATRDSSLMQSASGGDVSAADPASYPSAEFTSGGEGVHTSEPPVPIHPLNGMHALYGASSSGNGGTYRAFAPSTATTPASASTKPSGYASSLVGNTCPPVAGRVSSLLQKASGGSVVISDRAHARSAQFMAQQDQRADTASGGNMPPPSAQPSSINSAYASGLSHVDKTVSGFGVGGRVSSLLRKASGQSVVISETARARSAQFMSGAGTAGSDVADVPSASLAPPASATGGRISSLLQKASGGSVVISDSARAKSAQFMKQSSGSDGMSDIGANGGTHSTDAEGDLVSKGRVSSLLQKASGKSVIISDQALARSHQILAGDKETRDPSGPQNDLRTDFLYGAGQGMAMVPGAQGRGSADRGSAGAGAGAESNTGRVSSLLQKASGGALVISDAARVRSAQFMEDSAAGASALAAPSVHDSPSRPGRVSSLLQKASDKQVVISDAARARSAHFMAQNPPADSTGETLNHERGAAPTISTARTSSLLQKASGGAVVISAEARARSARFMSMPSESKEGSSGVLAAQASFDSLPPSRNLALLRGADEGDDESAHSAAAASAQASSLLQKASGKAVSISDDARARAAHFMQQNVGDPSEKASRPAAEKVQIMTVWEEKERNAGPLSPSRVSSLLQKASGKTVIISDEVRACSALFMARADRDVSAQHIAAVGGVVPAPEQAPPTGGRVSALLQKASGKSVVISDQARLRSAQLLGDSGCESGVRDGDSAHVAEQASLPLNAGHPGLGRVSSLLQKASGKAVVISDEARARSAQILSRADREREDLARGHMEDSSSSHSSAPGMHSSSLLQKASGKGVVISDEARARSAQFMQRASPAVTEQQVVPPGSTSSVDLSLVSENVTEGADVPVGAVAAEQKKPHTPMLLQKASGSSVVISDEARAKSAALMARLAQESANRSAQHQPAPVTPAPAPMALASRPHTFELPVFSSYTPRPSTAANLPPRFIAERMASSASSASNSGAPVSSLKVGISARQEKAGADPGSTHRPPLSNSHGDAKRKSVTFHADIVTDSVAKEAAPDSFTPEVTRRGSTESPTPQSTSSKPFNPARVLFDSIDDGEEIEKGEGELVGDKSESEGEENDEEDAEVPMFISTPLIDRASLLLFDPLQLDSPSPETHRAARPLPRALFSPQSEHPLHSVSSEQWQQDSPDFGYDSAHDFSAAALSAKSSEETGLKERLKLLCSVDSQNVVALLHFASAGALMLPTRGSALHGATFPPLLTRFYEEVLATSSRGAGTPAAVAESRKWLHMQYRWILWTLAAQERRHPSQYLGRLLTEDAVFEALQWRWGVYNSSVAPAVPVAITPAVQRSGDGSAGSTSATPASKRRRTTMYSTVTPSAYKASTFAARMNATFASESLPTATVPAGLNTPSLAIETTLHSSSPVLGSNGASRNAEAHFKRRGAMSPLQRCADIACLVWPLVVCFAGAAHSTSSATATAQVANKGTLLQVTDGWWWTCVQIDADLLKLFEKVIIRFLFEKVIFAIFTRY